MPKKRSGLKWRELNHDEMEVLGGLYELSSGKSKFQGWDSGIDVSRKNRPRVVNARGLVRYALGRSIWPGQISIPQEKENTYTLRYYDSLKRLYSAGLVDEGTRYKNLNQGFSINEKGIMEARHGALSFHTRTRRVQLASFFFLFAGFIFMALSDFTTTGNVVGSNSGADISFFLSFALMIIGGVLLFQSLRK